MITNMDEIKRVARVLLNTEVHFNDDFAFIVHHPFFQNSVYPIQDVNGMKLLDITKDDELEIARANMETLISRINDVFDLFMLMSKPYLPAFFKFANSYMSAADYARFLSEMWITVEFPNNDKNITAFQFVNLFKKANKQIMMSEEDWEYYKNLPETVKIYRGIRDGAKVRALSWTTDYQTAHWFANRWTDDGDVYSAEIDKKDILAYFSTRGESEVVVDFKKLKNIQKI